MPATIRGRGEWVSKVLETVLNLGLIMLAIILIIFLGKETFNMAEVLFAPTEQASKYLFIEALLVYFLYF